ncbi:uncharacterized protein LOC127291363 [Leptopilina boulardi]|uniref:uncharacterized protein LOC127291363 n=1 Tax=Leptopilina boulardi TaxID=63433 RepID=UPI0021F519A9|nr:uncharacterized protein LOC127291363 [Leptopilina boulardi]XP_051176408.1 uncharacterized protein LOC127291363 [Leptopilina boulardi]
MSDVINPYLKSHQEKCLLQGTSNPKSEWDTKNDSEIKYFTMDFKNYTITKMNHLICPEDVNDVHVRKLLQLATFNDSELIDDYIMEYVGAIKDQYDVVSLAIYYSIKFYFPITQIATLLNTCCSDTGTCVNGFTLLQTMILCNRSKEEIEIAVEAGIFKTGYSQMTNNKIITIECKQIIKLKNDSSNNLKNYFDIIEYLISIEPDQPSIEDFSYLAYVCFTNKDMIFEHRLWERITNLSEKFEIFHVLMQRLEIYGEKRLTEDNKYTILSLLKLSFEKVAIIFQKKELEDSVDSKLTHFELFGSLVLTHFTKAFYD